FEALPELGIDRPPPGELVAARAQGGAKLAVRDGPARHPDHRQARRQQPIARERVDGWHQLSAGQIAGGAENHHGARLRQPLLGETRPQGVWGRLLDRAHDATASARGAGCATLSSTSTRKSAPSQRETAGQKNVNWTGAPLPPVTGTSTNQSPSRVSVACRSRALRQPSCVTWSMKGAPARTRRVAP